MSKKKVLSESRSISKKKVLSEADEDCMTLSDLVPSLNADDSTVQVQNFQLPTSNFQLLTKLISTLACDLTHECMCSRNSISCPQCFTMSYVDIAVRFAIGAHSKILIFETLLLNCVSPSFMMTSSIDALTSKILSKNI